MPGSDSILRLNAAALGRVVVNDLIVIELDAGLYDQADHALPSSL